MAPPHVGHNRCNLSGTQPVSPVSTYTMPAAFLYPTVSRGCEVKEKQALVWLVGCQLWALLFLTHQRWDQRGSGALRSIRSGRQRGACQVSLRVSSLQAPTLNWHDRHIDWRGMYWRVNPNIPFNLGWDYHVTEFIFVSVLVSDMSFVLVD